MPALVMCAQQEKRQSYHIFSQKIISLFSNCALDNNLHDHNECGDSTFERQVYKKVKLKLNYIYHIDDLLKRNPKGKIEGVSFILNRPFHVIIIFHQMSEEFFLVFATNGFCVMIDTIKNQLCQCVAAVANLSAIVYAKLSLTLKEK